MEKANLENLITEPQPQEEFNPVVSRSPLGPVYTLMDEQRIMAAKKGAAEFMKDFGKGHDQMCRPRIVSDAEAHSQEVPVEVEPLAEPKPRRIVYTPDENTRMVFNTLGDAAAATGLTVAAVKNACGGHVKKWSGNFRYENCD